MKQHSPLFRALPYILLIAAFISGLLLLQPDILTQPPYWDTVVGSYHEGIWLAKNNFNYKELATSPSYIAGGPRIYLYSIYPTLIAVFIKLFGEGTTPFVLHHLISMLAAAGCLILLNTTLRHKVSRSWAWTGTGLMMSYPLFLSQSYAIGMDMLAALLAFWSVERFSRKHIKTAAILMILATCVKANTCVLSLACALYGLLMWPSLAGIRKWILLFFIPPVALLLQPHIDAHFFGNENIGMVDHLVNPWALLSLSQMLQIHTWHLYVFPDGWALLLTVVLCGMFFMFLNSSDTQPLRKRLWNNIQSDPALGLNFSIIAGMAILSLCTMTWLPRYLLIILPSLFYVFTRLLAASKKAGILIALLFATLSLFNIEGRLYESLHTLKPVGYDGGHLHERSLLWLKDQKHYHSLIDRLQHAYPAKNIVTPPPLCLVLKEPLMGYIEKPLNVYSFGPKSMEWNDLPNFRTAPSESLYGNEALWIDTRTVFTLNTSWMKNKEKVIEQIPADQPRFILFTRKPPATT